MNLFQTVVSYYMVNIQMGFLHMTAIGYGLAMASTAIAVMLGCSGNYNVLCLEDLSVIGFIRIFKN